MYLKRARKAPLPAPIKTYVIYDLEIMSLKNWPFRVNLGQLWITWSKFENTQPQTPTPKGQIIKKKYILFFIGENNINRKLKFEIHNTIR